MVDFKPVSEFEPVGESQNIKKIQETISPLRLRQAFMGEYGRPILEMGGLMGGAALGEAGTGGNPLGAVAGGGLGYSIGKQAADLIDEHLGIKKPEFLPTRLTTAGKDIARGAEMEAGGRMLAKGAGMAFEGSKQILGRLTGTGKAAIEQALRGTGSFRDALRKKISGKEIVGVFHDALQEVKTARQAIYQKRFDEMAKGDQLVDIQPVKDKLNNLLRKYVRIDPATGQPDWSRSALGPQKSEGVKRIQEIVEMIQDWGSKEGDNTAVGLDMLKRQLDDFYSESSNARAFVTNIRNVVKDTLIDSVPEYEKLVKGYSEATELIKDIEANLMMRKQGMSGRIVADQTLRRLISAMKDNFELRRDLVNTLGYASSRELEALLAGHSMSSYVPRGLAGTGPSLVGQAALAYFVSPKFWPVLIASSPRVSAEFLMQFGKGLQAMPGMSDTASKVIAYWIGREKPKQKVVRGGQ